MAEDDNELFLLERIEEQIYVISSCLAGSNHPKWFKAIAEANVDFNNLHNQIEGESVRDRIHSLIDWSFKLFELNDCEGKLFENGEFRLESQIFFRKIIEKRQELHSLIREITSNITDVSEKNRIENRKRNNDTRLAFSFDVLWHATKAIDNLTTLNHLLAKDGGNPYDISVNYDWQTRNSKFNRIERLLQQKEDDDPKKKALGHTQIIDHLLAIAYKKKYRKRRGIVYEEHIVFDGCCRYGSCYWKPARWGGQRDGADESNMTNFIQHYCSKDFFPEMFMILNDNCNKIECVAKHLSNIKTDEFKEIIPCRYLISFQNGIYNTDGGTFGTFHPWGASTEEYTGLASANFIKQDFPIEYMKIAGELGGANWNRIPTPNFQSILDYQNFGMKMSRSEENDDNDYIEEKTPYQVMLRSVHDAATELTTEIDEQINILENTNNRTDRLEGERKIRNILTGKLNDIQEAFDKERESQESANQPSAVNASGSEMLIDETSPTERTFPWSVQMWIYILIGRLLHPIGEKDDWQIIPLIVGRAGTGKSLIANCVKKMFSKEDVGTLSSNSEKQFGIEPLENKLIWVITELKRNLQLSAADFQSMVSGEDVSISKKNKVASTVKWSAPGLLCGNERPGWIDSQGSIARRIAIFNFKRGVKPADVNPDLQNEVYSELAALILKCNLAYLHTCATFQGQGIWKILPSYFFNERRVLQIATDVMTRAIEDTSRFELWTKIENNPDDIDTWYVKLTDIEAAYKYWWGQMRTTPYEPFTSETYGTCFDEAGLVEKHDTRPDPTTTTMGDTTTAWVIGIRAV